MNYEEFKKLSRPGLIIPIYRKFNADFITPVMAYLKLREAGKQSFLLESVIKGEQLGRYSFLSQEPYLIQKFQNQKTISISDHKNKIHQEDFFSLLQHRLKDYELAQIENLPRFTCGAVGYIGYEMINLIEKLPASKEDVIGSADALLGYYNQLIAFDHLKNEIILIANVFVDEDSDDYHLFQEAQNRLDHLQDKLNKPFNQSLKFNADWSTEKVNFHKEDFLKAVEKAKEYIFAGDIFQTVISQRFSITYNGDPFQVYRALRNINPSPYMFYLDFLDYQVIGSSPEPLIRAEDNELEIIPIAGTRQRGRDKTEDEALARELLNDPKELAEHVMLVDLARNDIGRISRHGSVKVTDFKTIQKYSHVMHIISRVHGKLHAGLTVVDAFKAAFPAGTVSGAPKIRAMEIINELEPEKRGIYSGAIGYFNYGGNMDLCIAIRTIVASKGHMYYQAGAGIVADSIPENEYRETLNKCQALRRAIEQAAGGINDLISR
jgi:anthranilate synthase component 1